MKTTYELSEIKWGIVFLKMTKVRFFSLSILLIVLQATAYSQKMPQKMWHSGSVVLESEDTLRGKIQYDFESNLVQFTSGNTVKTFTSQNLLFFIFQCEFFNRVRRVYSIPYELKGSVKIPVFFEILEEGTITLMTREYLVVENNNRFSSSMYRNAPSFGSREILTYDYFLLTQDGAIHKFSEKRKDLAPFFGQYADRMIDYIKKNNLRVEKQSDLVRIFKYYNKIVAAK